MPSYSRKVDIPGKSSQELYDKIAQDIEKFLSKIPLGKMEIIRNSSAKKVSVESSMAKATLSCQEGCIEIEAKLSLFAAPFRSKLDEGIDKWLSKTFGL